MSDSNQYPPQTGLYKIKIKEGGTSWREYDRLRLEISVGQSYHEGAKMEATLKWAKSRFPHVSILVNDTLQRFNLMFEQGLSEDVAERITWREGETWIERHRPFLDGSSLYRWNEWKTRPDYERALTESRRIYTNNHAFSAAVDEAINDVWFRRVGTDSIFLPERKEEFFFHSQNYLLEETAVFALAYKELPGISAYPGSFQKMWAMFVDSAIKGPLKGLNNAHCMRIDFQRNKSYRPAQKTPATEQNVWVPDAATAWA